MLVPVELAGGRFHAVEKLGEGGFGAIFLAIDLNHRDYIVKAESTHRTYRSVLNEARIYRSMAAGLGRSAVLGIPQVFYSGTLRQLGDEYDVLVMEPLGDNLYEMMKEKGHLSLKSILSIGLQMLRILEDIHSRGILHRDIKPDNILTGLSPTDRSSLYLCDFGIAKHTSCDSESRFRDTCFYGTPLFASRRALKYEELGRCDDLESLCYTMVFLMLGSLPWGHLPLDAEQAIEARELCFDPVWSGLPPEMSMCFDYISSLDTREKPDYEYLRFLLTEALNSVGEVNDGEFEWCPRARICVVSDYEQVEDSDKQDNDAIECVGSRLQSRTFNQNTKAKPSFIVRLVQNVKRKIFRMCRKLWCGAHHAAEQNSSHSEHLTPERF